MRKFIPGLCLAVFFFPAALPTLAQTPTTQEQEKQSDKTAESTPMAVTLHIENDSRYTKFFDSHDRHYTSGLKLVFGAQPDWANDLQKATENLPAMGWFNDPFINGKNAVGIVAGQNFYTPDRITNPAPNDEPYAGWLYGGIFWQRADHDNEAGHSTMLDHFEIDLGMVGPSALGEQTQKWWHRTGNFDLPVGWDQQIRDEFVFDLTYRRKWIVDLYQGDRHLNDSFGVQLIPQVGLTLGTLHRQAQAGATLRAGWQLPDDFGIGRISDPATYTHLSKPHQRSCYFFVQGLGHAVEHNLLLDGNSYQNSPHTVDSEPLTGEVTYGIAVQFCEHLQATYSQTYLTDQFKHQRTTDSYGAVTLTCFFAF